MTLSWQREPKIIQYERALKRELLSQPEVKKALVNYINSLNLPDQVKKNHMTPTEATQQFQEKGQEAINRVTAYAKKQVQWYIRDHELQAPKLQPQKSQQPAQPLNQNDFTIPQNMEAARLNPNSPINAPINEEMAAVAAILASMDLEKMAEEVAYEVSTLTATQLSEPDEVVQQNPSHDTEDGVILAGLKAIDEGGKHEIESAVGKIIGIQGGEVKGFEEKSEQAVEKEFSRTPTPRPPPPTDDRK